MLLTCGLGVRASGVLCGGCVVMVVRARLVERPPLAHPFSAALVASLSVAERSELGRGSERGRGADLRMVAAWPTPAGLVPNSGRTKACCGLRRSCVARRWADLGQTWAILGAAPNNLGASSTDFGTNSAKFVLDSSNCDLGQICRDLHGSWPELRQVGRFQPTLTDIGQNSGRSRLMQHAIDT